MTEPIRRRRVLFCNRNCYFDDANGAAVASRAMMEALSRLGFAVEALTGSMIEAGPQADPHAWRKAHGIEISFEGATLTVDPRGIRNDAPPQDRRVVRGVPVTVHRGSTKVARETEEAEAREFLELFDSVSARFRPDVLVNFGGDRLSMEIRSRAKARGIAVVFALHNFSYHHAGPFADVDAVIVPSRLASEHYRRTLGLECQVLPNLIDLARIRAERPDPRYVTFINPSFEKGVYAFARIAEELGRKRPEIPLLVVEARGSERTLADCGIDLTRSGNVFLMDHTPEPRRFWSVTKVCLVPSVCSEIQCLAAVESMFNGTPVIASDRGALPETLGNAGIVLPLPEWMTPHTRVLPTSKEIAPWVNAIIRLMDDAEFLNDHRQKARIEASRSGSEILEPLYGSFFGGVVKKGT
jgi:glycosyltransferase involved in cell wall biosynthesis